jgi:hypothetical protein
MEESIPAEFMTRDGAMQYRMIPVPPPLRYRVALQTRAHVLSFGRSGDFTPADRPLEMESREYELIDVKEGLLVYREM